MVNKISDKYAKFLQTEKKFNLNIKVMKQLKGKKN